MLKQLKYFQSVVRPQPPYGPQTRGGVYAKCGQVSLCKPPKKGCHFLSKSA